MQGLVDYASDSSSGGGGDARSPVDDPLNPAGTTAAHPSTSSSDGSEASDAPSAASDDSKRVRAAAAAARLAALDEESARATAAASAAAGPSSTALLPDPLAALGATAAAPDFLRPAATRAPAAPVHRGGPGLVERRDEPPLAKRPRAGPAAPAAAAPPAGGVASAAVEAAQWAAAAAADTVTGAKGVPDRQATGGHHRATPAMPVAEALATGAPLPRRGQTVKDRQRAKAAAGQRATGEWKPEAYMIMRQQYD